MMLFVKIVLKQNTMHFFICLEKAQGKIVFGKDYFQKLLESVRSIRARERRIWQQITIDIYK